MKRKNEISKSNSRAKKQKILKSSSSRPKHAVLVRVTELTENNDQDLSPPRIDLSRTPLVIGRNPDKVDVVVANFPGDAGTPKDPVHVISRVHGRFIWNGSTWVYNSVGANGSVLQRGEQCIKMTKNKNGKASLKSGDVIVFGRESMKSKQFGTCDNVCVYEFQYEEDMESEPDINLDDATSRLRLAEQHEEEERERERQRIRDMKMKEAEELLRRKQEKMLKREEELAKQAQEIVRQKREEEARRLEEENRRKEEEQRSLQKLAEMEKQEAALREKENAIRAEKEKLDQERALQSRKLLQEKRDLEEKEANLAKKAEGLQKEKAETTQLREKELAEIRKQKEELQKKLLAESKTLEEFNCSFCLDIVYAPVSLNCSHTFCEHCIAPWLKTLASAACPQCRAPITHQTSVSVQIKNIIENALESVGTESQKQEYQDNKERHEEWLEKKRQEEAAARRRNLARRGGGAVGNRRGRGRGRGRRRAHNPYAFVDLTQPEGHSAAVYRHNGDVWF